MPLGIARELDDPALLVRALLACGSASVYDAEVSGRYLAEASDLARALGDRWRLSQILSQQAQAAFVAGDPGGVRIAAEEGRDIADAIGDRFGIAAVPVEARRSATLEGDLVESIAQHRAVIAESEADHDIISLATALMVLPHALAFHGEAEEALAVARLGIESATDLGDVYRGRELHGVEHGALGRRRRRRGVGSGERGLVPSR